MQDMTQDPRWQAVLTRDRQASFFYAVRTTGVYCRPSCGSRRPRPEHVSFHATATAAQAAGFRACKRCRPETEVDPLVSQVCRQLQEVERTPTLAELAKAAGLSPFHLQRRFKAATGLSPRQYAAAHRAQVARDALAAGKSVTHAMHQAGYGSTSRFHAQAAARLGMPASRFRQGGQAVRMQFAFGRSSLGLVLVAATDRGVCAILFGDDRMELEADLRRRFPRAQVEPGRAAFTRTVARAIAVIENPVKVSRLPLDLRGTVFQERVWRELVKVGPGRTTSYLALARAIGRPSASRAVGQAVGANHLAVAVPCHRVLHADGGLAGYHWGTQRKRALLDRER